MAWLVGKERWASHVYVQMADEPPGKLISLTVDGLHYENFTDVYKYIVAKCYIRIPSDAIVSIRNNLSTLVMARVRSSMLGFIKFGLDCNIGRQSDTILCSDLPAMLLHLTCFGQHSLTPPELFDRLKDNYGAYRTWVSF